MTWWKAIIIGFSIYWGVFLVSFVLFVGFGLGYHFSNLANTLGGILVFPGGHKNGNLFLSMLFWTIALAIAIKIFSFLINLKKG